MEAGLHSTPPAAEYDQSPYLVVGSVLVPSGSTLTVEPDVSVRFALGTKLIASGELEMLGGASDSATQFLGAHGSRIHVVDDATGPAVRLLNCVCKG